MKKTTKMVTLFCIFALIGSMTMFAAGQRDTAASDVVELTVWDFKYSEEIVGGALKDMDSLFMASNPNVKINHVAQPHDNYYEILAAALSSGKGPDVIMTHTDQRIWNMQEFLLPLDEHIADWRNNIADSAWQASSSTKEVDKNIMMVPLTAQGLGIYYNKANLERAGVDTTVVPNDWDAFLDACEKMKQAGITPIIMGNAGMPYGIDFAYRTFLANFYGPELVGFRDGTANFTDEAFVEASSMLKTLFSRGYVNVENASIPYFMDAIELFKAGEGGFFFGLTSDIAHWKDFGDAFGYENLGYMPSINSDKAKYSDRQSSQGAGIALAILKNSKNIPQALDFVYSYLHGESANLFLTRTGAIVPNKTIPIQNETLATVVDYMSNNAVPDFYVQLDAAFGSEMYNFFQLFFLADEISLNTYITRLQQAYKQNL
jgi:raffinose/stachyose/melibiose transport system substrate-binding protein